MDDEKSVENAEIAIECTPNMSLEEQEINRLSEKLFEKATDYLQSELRMTTEDYKLLQKMNEMTAKKYSAMKEVGENIASSLSELHSKYQSLGAYFEEIDKLDEKVAKLEEIAYAIDGYTKRLEAKYKKSENPVVK